MKTQINITQNNKQISINAPYSATNNVIYRSRGGKFSKDTSAWVFAKSQAVETMITDLWGKDSALVQVEISGEDDQIEKTKNEWMLKGYKIASRRGRDCRVETPEGVQLAQGIWERSGGSVKNPRVGSASGLVLHVVVRRSFAEREGLKIIAEDTEFNPLAQFTDEELINEIKRRGL